MTTQTAAIYRDLSEPGELFPPEVEQLELIEHEPGTYGADCLVCGLSSRFPLSRPQICDLCCEDLARSRAHIARLRAAAETRLQEAEAAYQLAMASAAPADRARLGTIDMLRAAAPRSGVARQQLHAYLNSPDRFGEAWATLLRAASSRIATLYTCQVQLSRCDRADRALDLLGVT